MNIVIVDDDPVNVALLKALVKQLPDSVAVPFTDPHAGAHIQRMARYFRPIAQRMDMSEAVQDLLSQARPCMTSARSGHPTTSCSSPADYPQRLAGEDIALIDRIVAIADVFDALTSIRPYKQASSHKRARTMRSSANIRAW